MTTPRATPPLASDPPGSPERAPALTPQRQQQIAIGALVLALLLGAGIVYWFLIGSKPRARQVKVNPAQQRVDLRAFGGGRGPVRLPRGPAKGIEKTDATRWQIRGDAGGATVTRTPAPAAPAAPANANAAPANAAPANAAAAAAAPGGAGAQYTFAFFYSGPSTLSPEQAALWTAHRRMLRDQAMAKEWGVTPEQARQLKAIDFSGIELRPSPQDRQALSQLFAGYVAATSGPARMDAQKQVVDKLDAIARASRDDARKNLVAGIDRIKATLTPEQVERIAKP